MLWTVLLRLGSLAEAFSLHQQERAERRVKRHVRIMLLPAEGPGIAAGDTYSIGSFHPELKVCSAGCTTADMLTSGQNDNFKRVIQELAEEAKLPIEGRFHVDVDCVRFQQQHPEYAQTRSDAIR